MDSTTSHELIKAIEVFQQNFNTIPTTCSFAPGRVNLIGEHTDYNDGFVLPFALPFRTYIVGSLTTDKESKIISISDHLPPSTFIIDENLSKGEPSWANYVKGTVYQYLKELPSGFAFNAVISSNVPIGSGLSSSAALEVATATFIEQLLSITHVNKVQKALRCQKAEHTFADTPCGIMDQYISTMGSKGNLLLIDCRSNDFKLVPYGIGKDSPVILITNSNVKHQLSGSEYPDRVRQCKEAVSCIQTKYPQVKALRDATIEMLNGVTTSELVYRRAKHCITEDIRTQSAVKALSNNDFISLGKYMTESHFSLQNDFEVSCSELDVLVKIALSVPGVYGSRMTGGGFGGCTVTLVRKDAVNELKRILDENYFKQVHMKCSFYECEPSDGATVLNLDTIINTTTTTTTNNNNNTSNTSKQSNNDLESSWLDYIIPITVLGLSISVGLLYFLRKKN